MCTQPYLSIIESATRLSDAIAVSATHIRRRGLSRQRAAVLSERFLLSS